jgi:hypothetical protein
VEEEVMAQACQRCPDLCYDEESVKKAPQQTKDPRSGIKLRVLAWLSGWRRKVEAKEVLNFVSGDEAARRADVCAKCPQHCPYPTGCGSCRAALSKLRESVIGTHLPLDQRLAGCEVLGYDLQVATHMDMVRLNNKELPAGCWMRTEL